LLKNSAIHALSIAGEHLTSELHQTLLVNVRHLILPDIHDNSCYNRGSAGQRLLGVLSANDQALCPGRCTQGFPGRAIIDTRNNHNIDAFKQRLQQALREFSGR
jgi:hypothetical protein